MFRPLWTCLTCALLLIASNAKAEDRVATFPKISTKNLNDRPATFPAGLPGKRSLVLIAFKRDQQSKLDVWIEKLKLKQPDAPAWIEMPVVADYGSIWRAFVDNGMRSGIKTTRARSHVFTVYGDQQEFLAKLNLPTTNMVYVLVVQQDGRVLARADGIYSATKAKPLLKAMSSGTKAPR